MNESLLDQKPSGSGQPAPDCQQPAGLLSRADLARELRVCVHTIARMERRGMIRGLRFNARLIRYQASELARLVKEAA